MQSRIDNLFRELKGDGCVLIKSYPNIFYYSGFTSEDAFLLILKDRRYIITDSRYFIQARIESPDFELVDISKGWGYIFSLIPCDTIYFEENRMSYGMYKRLSGNTKIEFCPSQAEIDKPRRIKDNEEIRLISEAEKIGDEAFINLLEILRAGMTEREVALELEMRMKRQGASDLSFDTIVASGVRSSMPHGVASDKVIEKGDFVTLDFGCVYKGYCSDMTRTVIIGNPDSRQEEVYNLVLKAQKTAIDGLYNGIACSKADKIARDAITEGGYGEYFTHSLGHSVGIEIHELPNFSPKSVDILENGNVLSIEPGIYIDGWGGVRIEDLIAVNDGKITNLSHSPKELVVI